MKFSTTRQIGVQTQKVASRKVVFDGVEYTSVDQLPDSMPTEVRERLMAQLREPVGQATTSVEINGVEYSLEDLPEKYRAMLDHDNDGELTLHDLTAAITDLTGKATESGSLPQAVNEETFVSNGLQSNLDWRAVLVLIALGIIAYAVFV